MKPACSICGTAQRKFVSYNGRKHARCPSCHGLERHRSVFSALKQLEVFTRFKRRTALLMVSMDSAYFARLKRHFNVSVLTLEKHQRGTTYGNVCAPPFKPNTFVIVLQVHMLEHEKNDREATRSIYGLMKHGGVYISNVPCRGDKTVEFGKAQSDQHGHWRLYGVADYMQLLCDCGFVRVRRLGSTFVAEKV